MKALQLVLLVVVVAACGGGANETSAPTTVTGPVETFVPDNADVHQMIYQTGVNGVGLTELPQANWVQLAEAGCREGGWDWAVARSLAIEFLDAFDSAGSVPVDDMAQSVWLVTVTGCRDRFPQGALDLGPPPIGG